MTVILFYIRLYFIFQHQNPRAPWRAHHPPPPHRESACTPRSTHHQARAHRARSAYRETRASRANRARTDLQNLGHWKARPGPCTLSWPYICAFFLALRNMTRFIGWRFYSEMFSRSILAWISLCFRSNISYILLVSEKSIKHFMA